MTAPIDGIDHIEFNVENLDEMVTFLKKAGFTETRRTPHTGGAVELRFPGGLDAPILELNSSLKHPRGLQHIALRTSDIEAAYEHYRALGFTFIKPLPKEPSPSGRRVFNIIDPQGNKLQVSTRIDAT